MEEEDTNEERRAKVVMHIQLNCVIICCCSSCRAKLRAIEEERLREEREKQEKFDALPDWKKKILLKKKEEKE